MNDSTINEVNSSYYSPGGCRNQVRAVFSHSSARLTRIQIINCANTGTDSVCSQAQDSCNGEILGPLSGDWDVYYVLDREPSNYPSDPTTWLNSQKTKIGAEKTWDQSNSVVYENFFNTG